MFFKKGGTIKLTSRLFRAWSWLNKHMGEYYEKNINLWFCNIFNNFRCRV